MDLGPKFGRGLAGIEDNLGFIMWASLFINQSLPQNM